MPNFDQISQSTAEILLFPVSANKRLPWISTSGSDIDLFAVIGMWFRTDIPIFVKKLDDRRRSYDVISIFQDGDHSVANLLPVFGLVMTRISELEVKSNLHTKFRPDINPRLRYYCFWFLKTKARHIKIILPLSILTSSSSWACDSALIYQIYANWMIWLSTE